MENFTSESAKPAIVQEIWAILRENARGMAEFRESMAELKERQRKTDLQMEETDRIVKENALRMKETDRLFKETELQMKETDRKIEKMFRKTKKHGHDIGGLRNSVGWLVESFFQARIWELMKGYSYGFDSALRRQPFYAPGNPEPLGDVDLLLIGSEEWAMAIEVKSFAMQKDLTRFLKRLELLREHPHKEIKGKKILAGFAAVGYDKDVCEGVHEAGLFAFSLNKKLGKFLPPPEGFTPAVWDTADGS